MKILLPFLALALLFSFGSEAIGKPAEVQVAKRVIKDYQKSQKAIARTKMPAGSIADITNELDCTSAIFSGIEKSSMSESNKEDWSFATYIVFIYDVYLTLAEDNAKSLQKEARLLNARGERLLAQHSSSSSKRMIEAMKAQGTFAKYFAAQNFDISMCTTQARVEELGGYNHNNLETAFTEELQEPGLLDFINDKNNRMEKISQKISRGSGEMVRLKINKKQVARFATNLLDVLIKRVDNVLEGSNSLKYHKLRLSPLSESPAVKILKNASLKG